MDDVRIQKASFVVAAAKEQAGARRAPELGAR